MNRSERKQTAVQLVGPDELVVKSEKEVFQPGPHQILAEVEAVGLCFSDLKLLRQFSRHPRKSSIVSGIEQSVLDEIGSYVPDEKPTVPGHEASVRIVEVGKAVKGVEVGRRYLVQTDYRWLPTKGSNGSFGYNFEGALQQYVLMDERVIRSPEGKLFLLPASDSLSASAVALVEPWACVEDAYRDPCRSEAKTGGQMLIIVEADIEPAVLEGFLHRFGRPEKLTILCETSLGLDDIGGVQTISHFDEAPDYTFDDVIYIGSRIESVQKAFVKLRHRGLLNIVQAGGNFGGSFELNLGRTHYGCIRIIGTTGGDPAESLEAIPAGAEIQAGDKINILGAAGPMGTMHVVRNLCQGVEGIEIYAADVDKQRLELLSKIAEPLARENRLVYKPYDPKEEKPVPGYDYVVVLAPIPALVTKAVADVGKGAIINVFAGIAPDVPVEIDMDAYIKKGLYLVGTSGSVLEDMRVVLAKVESGQLDTNLSVAAVSGIGAAPEGIEAVKNHTIPGKIVVYPQCKGLGLVTLEEMAETMPEVASKLRDGLWNQEAEQALLTKYAGQRK
jgi:threonine dehydrogenase-like Zn-dependent dehydrogenase